MSVTQERVIYGHTWCIYEICMRIPFPNAGVSEIICICLLLIFSSADISGEFK